MYVLVTLNPPFSSPVKKKPGRKPKSEKTGAESPQKTPKKDKSPVKAPKQKKQQKVEAEESSPVLNQVQTHSVSNNLSPEDTSDSQLLQTPSSSSVSNEALLPAASAEATPTTNKKPRKMSKKQVGSQTQSFFK